MQFQRFDMDLLPTVGQWQQRSKCMVGWMMEDKALVTILSTGFITHILQSKY